MATKKRLIDADAFKSFLCKCCNILRSEEPCEPSDCNILAVIDEQPTVDAVEVVHGEWVNPYMNRYGHPCHCCSVCGFKASYQDKNYCPNCGAKMDLKGE